MAPLSSRCQPLRAHEGVLRNIIKMIDIEHIKRCLGLHVVGKGTVSRCNYSYLSSLLSQDTKKPRIVRAGIMREKRTKSAIRKRQIHIQRSLILSRCNKLASVELRPQFPENINNGRYFQFPLIHDTRYMSHVERRTSINNCQSGTLLKVNLDTGCNLYVVYCDVFLEKYLFTIKNPLIV